jgi:hypothetical protein
MDPNHPEQWNNVREAGGNNKGEEDVEVLVDATGEAGTMNGIDESVHQGVCVVWNANRQS